MRPLLLAALTLAPSLALACGGLFCNAAQPVEQAAERILFVVDDGRIDMHVRLTYSGPPADFGWLLPVPPGVETAVSSEALFAALDALHAPRFQLDRQNDPDCDAPPRPDWGFSGADASAQWDAGEQNAEPEPEPEPPVQVLSREAVGPYDRVVLAAESVEALRTWLDDNEFAIPEETDARLAPYLEAGAHFVAIRLLADAAASDVVPLMLSFPGDRPAIPIVPTAVAATPDMGIIVHILGDQRAIPVNYLHVEINEAAVDWEGGGRNYGDVVAQAADEAGGKAFATDFAGPVDPQLIDALRPLPDDLLQAVEQVDGVEQLARLAWPTRNDPDVLRVLAAEFGVPEGVTPRQFFACTRCYDIEDPSLDGAALAARLREEVQPAREALAAHFEARPILTRLYSAMSPAEMDLDPIFSFNPDLDPVERVRQAVLWVPCNDAAPGEARGVGWNWDAREIRLADGRSFAADVEPIQRQGGEQMRGSVPAARRIDQLTEAGQPMRVEGMDPEAPGGPDHLPGAGPSGPDPGTNEAGCACDATREGGGAALLALFALLGLGRRRARRPFADVRVTPGG